MFLFSFFSTENIILLGMAALLYYFHWSLPLFFLLIDIVWICKQNGKCFLKNGKLQVYQNQANKEKRLVVWRKKPLRNLLCPFEKRCVATGQLLDSILEQPAIVENMNDALRQLQGEFVDALYEFYVVNKLCQKENSEHACADLKHVKEKISFIEQRLQSLVDSVNLVKENTVKMQELGLAMDQISKAFQPKANE